MSRWRSLLAALLAALAWLGGWRAGRRAATRRATASAAHRHRQEIARGTSTCGPTVTD